MICPALTPIVVRIWQLAFHESTWHDPSLTDGMSDTGLQRSISPCTMASGRRSVVGQESAVGFQTNNPMIKSSFGVDVPLEDD